MLNKFNPGDRVYLVPEVYHKKVKGTKTDNVYVFLKEGDLGTIIESNNELTFIKWDKYPNMKVWIMTKFSNDFIKKYEKGIDNGAGI